MATQGQDPSDMVNKIAAVIKARQKGQALEDAQLSVLLTQQKLGETLPQHQAQIIYF